MKTFVFASALLLASVSGLRAETPAAALAAPAPAYPLTTCVVSDEELGSMGKSITYTHKEEGKPDRVVLLCCKGCVRDFKKDPAKYLAKLDAAPAVATPAVTPTATPTPAK